MPYLVEILLDISDGFMMAEEVLYQLEGTVGDGGGGQRGYPLFVDEHEGVQEKAQHVFVRPRAAPKQIQSRILGHTGEIQNPVRRPLVDAQLFGHIPVVVAQDVLGVEVGLGIRGKTVVPDMDGQILVHVEGAFDIGSGSGVGRGFRIGDQQDGPHKGQKCEVLFELASSGQIENQKLVGAVQLPGKVPVDLLEQCGPLHLFELRCRKDKIEMFENRGNETLQTLHRPARRSAHPRLIRPPPGPDRVATSDRGSRSIRAVAYPFRAQ